MSDSPSVSVIIPAYNEERIIADCLNALVHQTTKEPFEVILVDNNSKDRTSEIANTFKDTLNLRVILETTQGRGTARATGFREAKGTILFSTDADSQVPPNWIEEMLRELRESKAMAVTGPCHINDCPPFTNWVFNIIQPISMHLYRVVFRHYWMSGFNFAIHREFYEKAGGFKGDIDAQEDTEFGFRAYKLGRIQYVPTMNILVSGRRMKHGLLDGIWQYIKSFTQAVLLHKNAYLSSER